MDDLATRLRDAARALDAHAPVFDAEALQRRASDAAAPPARPLVPVDADIPVRRGRPARALVLLAVAAAALVLVIGGIAVIDRRSTIDTGPGASIPSGELGPPDSTSATTAGARASALPDVLEVTCNGDGTVVSAPVVRAQADGVHLRIHNPHPMAGIMLDLGDPSMVGGQRGVPFGDSDLVEPIMPGVRAIGCGETGALVVPAEVEVVDEAGWWIDPTLGCSAPSGPTSTGQGVPRSRPTAAEAVRAWEGVDDDTTLRTVRYPEGERLEIVAATAEGDIQFAALRLDDARWMAIPGRWCTPAPPVLAIDPDPVRAWFDRTDLDFTTGQLTQRLVGESDLDPEEQAMFVCSMLASSANALELPDGEPVADLVRLATTARPAVEDALRACRIDPDDPAVGFDEGRARLALDALIELRDAVDARR